jgi:hypothetical protein
VVLKKTAKKHSGLGTASEWEALKRAAFDLGEMMKNSKNSAGRE